MSETKNNAGRRIFLRLAGLTGLAGLVAAAGGIVSNQISGFRSENEPAANPQGKDLESVAKYYPEMAEKPVRQHLTIKTGSGKVVEIINFTDHELDAAAVLELYNQFEIIAKSEISDPFGSGEKSKLVATQNKKFFIVDVNSPNPAWSGNPNSVAETKTDLLTTTTKSFIKIGLDYPEANNMLATEAGNQTLQTASPLVGDLINNALGRVLIAKADGLSYEQYSQKYRGQKITDPSGRARADLPILDERSYNALPTLELPFKN